MKRILPILAVLLVFSLTVHAEDIRLQPLKDLNGYFPFNPPSSLREWETRKEYVRRQILVAAGLWPMPTKTPLNAVIHGKIDRGEYTVEKVYFESAPGFFVTGNLYRPKNIQGKVPGVMFAHGHRENARSLPDSRGQAAQGDRRRRGALRARRAQHVPVAVPPARAHGLRRLAVGHAQRLGFDPVLAPGRARLRQAAAGDEHDGELGPLQPAGRGASARASWACRRSMPCAASISCSACPRWTRSASPSPARAAAARRRCSWRRLTTASSSPSPS